MVCNNRFYVSVSGLYDPGGRTVRREARLSDGKSGLSACVRYYRGATWWSRCFLGLSIRKSRTIHVRVGLSGQRFERFNRACRRFETGGSLGRRVKCRRVPQPRWVGARPSAKGGREVAGDRRERGGNPAAFVFVPRPGRVRLQ
jgi:hypothetical protein